MIKENGSKKRWGRRLGATIGAAILVTVAYYVVLFRGAELMWWVEYAKYTTYFLGFLVGGLSLTDVIGVMKKKE